MHTHLSTYMLYQQVKCIKHLNINSIQFSIILSDSIIIWCAHAQRIAHTTCTMKLLAFCGFSRSVCSAQVRNASQRQQFLFECSNSHLASSTLLVFYIIYGILWIPFMKFFQSIVSTANFEAANKQGSLNAAKSQADGGALYPPCSTMTSKPCLERSLTANLVESGHLHGSAGGPTTHGVETGC